MVKIDETCNSEMNSDKTRGKRKATANILATINELGQWYAIRLSSFESLDLEKTKEMLKDYKYILSEEGDDISTKYHQHIVLVTDLTTEEIRKIIKQVYPDCSGNKCLYIKASRDNKQLAKYTLKEGKYCYKGFTAEWIEEMFKTSTKKTDMKKDFKDLEDNFMLDKIDFDEFCEQYFILKATYDQPLYMNHIEAYLRGRYLRKNPKFAKELTSVIKDRLFK